MTTTLRRYHPPVERARAPRPHLHPIAAEVGRALGKSPKHGERLLHTWLRVNAIIVGAARRAGRMDWLAFACAGFDAERQLHPALPLPLTLDLLHTVAKAERREDESREAFLARQTPTHLRALRTQLVREIDDKRELLAAIDGQLAGGAA